MLQLNAVKHVKIGPKRRGDKKLPVEFISVYGTIFLSKCYVFDALLGLFFVQTEPKCQTILNSPAIAFLKISYIAQWSEVYAVLTDGKNIQAGSSKKVKSP